MEKTIDELNMIVEAFTTKIKNIPENEFSYKPLPDKWSKKEVLGHLIDSGQNNLRRFICGQYEKTTTKITYDQDFWVAANAYQEMKKDDVILMWRLINQRMSEVIRNMPVENYIRSCDTGKDRIDLHTLQWLADDYVKHMKHHLNQIIPGSFDVNYK